MIRIGIGGNILTPDELVLCIASIDQTPTNRAHASKLREILQGLRA